MEKRIFRVEKIEQNKRVDKYLVEKLKVYSREFVKVLCKNKFIKLFCRMYFKKWWFINN